MSIIHRVFKSIVRNKQKTILLLLIFFVIGNAIAVAVAVGIGTKNVEIQIKQKLGAVVKYGGDHAYWKRLLEEANRNPEVLDGIIDRNQEQIELTGNTGEVYSFPVIPNVVIEDKIATRRDHLKQMLESNLLKAYDFNVVTVAGSSTLTFAGTDLLPPEYQDPNENYFGLTLRGTDYAPLLVLEGGGAKLVDGRTFTPEEVTEGQSVTLISKEFAELNELAVGDRLMITHYPTLALQPDFIAGRIDLNFDIIGIYQDNALPVLDRSDQDGLSNEEGQELWLAKNRLNTFWVPNQVLVDLEAEAQSMLLAKGVPEEIIRQSSFNVDAETFLLHSPDDVDAFITEFSPYVPEGFKLFSNQNIFNEIKGPLQQTQQMADSVLLFSVAVAVLIIGLTVLMFIRDRKRELGILMALGESKQKLVLQVMLEVLLIAVIGVVISLISGQLIATQISESMIEDQLVADIDLTSDDEYLSIRQEMGQYVSDLTPEQVADNYQIKFSLKYIGLFALIYTGTSLMATAIPTWYIVRLEPKRVLMN